MSLTIMLYLHIYETFYIIIYQIIKSILC